MLTGAISKQGNLPDMPVIGYKAGEEIQAAVNVATGFMTAEVKCMRIGANNLALGADFVYSSAMTENIAYGEMRTACAPGWKLNLQQYLLPARHGESVVFGEETLAVDYVYVDPAGNKHYIVQGADCSGLGLTLSETSGRKHLTDMQGNVLEFFEGKLVKVRRMTGYEEYSSTPAYTDIKYQYNGDRLKCVSVDGTGAGRAIWVIYDENDRIAKLYCDGNKHQIVPEYAATGEMTGIYRVRGSKRERVCELASGSVSAQAAKKLRRIVSETGKALQFIMSDEGTVMRVTEGGYTPDNAGFSINEKRADQYYLQNKYQTDILNERKRVTLHYSFDDDGFLVSVLESSDRFPNHLTSLMPAKKVNSGFSILGDRGTANQFNGHDIFEPAGFEKAEDNYQKNITSEIRNGFYKWNTLPGVNTKDNLFVFSGWVNNELCGKACIQLQIDNVPTIFLKLDTVKKGWQYLQTVCAFPKSDLTGVKLIVLKESAGNIKLADLKMSRLPTPVPVFSDECPVNSISTVKYNKNGISHSISTLVTQKDVEMTMRSKFSNYGGIGTRYDLFMNNGRIHIVGATNIAYVSAQKQKTINLADNQKTSNFYENTKSELFFGAITRGIDNKRNDYDFIVYMRQNGKTIARNYKTAKLGDITTATYTDYDMLGNVLEECDQYGVLKKNRYDAFGNVTETILVHKDDPEDSTDKIVLYTQYTQTGEYPSATFPATQPGHNPNYSTRSQFENLSGRQTVTKDSDHQIFYTYDSFYRKTESVVFTDTEEKYLTGIYYDYDQNGRIERVTANKKDGYRLKYDEYGNFCGVDRTKIACEGLQLGAAYCGEVATNDPVFSEENIYGCNYEFDGKSVESYGIGRPEFTTYYNQNSEITEHVMKENGQTTRLLRNVYRDDADPNKELCSSAAKLRESYDYAQKVMYEYEFDENDNVCNYNMYRLADNDQKGSLLTSVKNVTYDKENEDENASVYTYFNPVRDVRQSVVYDPKVLIAPRIKSVHNFNNATYYFYDKLGRISRVVNHHGKEGSTWFYVAQDYIYKNVSIHESVLSTTDLVQDVNVAKWYGNIVNPPITKTYHCEYTWDGRLESVTEQNLDGEDTSEKTLQYNYDALGRLYLIDDLASNQTTTYLYDAEGNITEKSVSRTNPSSINFTYEGDRLLSAKKSGEDVKYFAYDRYGNPTHYGVRQDKLTQAGNMTFTRVNLLSAYNGNNYFYDAGGKLYKMTTSNGWTKEFFYDCEKLTSEIWTRQDGKTIKLQYGHNASGVCDITVKNTENKLKTYYYEKDCDGSITGIFDWQYDKIRYAAKYKYDANGNCKIEHAINGNEVIYGGDDYEIEYQDRLYELPGNINPFRWKGLRYEHNSKFYNLGSRFYDPELMRWVTAESPKSVSDSIGSAYGLNRYIFAGNNPLAVSARAESCLPEIDLVPETKVYDWWDYNGWIFMIFVGIVLIAAAAVIGGAGAAAGACGSVSMSAAGMAAMTAGTQALVAALSAALIGGTIGFLSGMLSSQANGATDDILDNALNGAIQGACMGFLTGALTGFVGQVAKVISMPRSCFVAGTLVKTKDGDKRIEEIEVDDEVWSYDEVTGKSDWKKVVQLFRNSTDSWCTIKVRAERDKVENGKTVKADRIRTETLNADEADNLFSITSTPGHKYYVPENRENREIGEKNEHASYEGLSVQWVSAVNLKPGDRVLLSDGKYGIVQEVKVRKLEHPETTYNLEVEDSHTYYVGESGVCVHNTDCGTPKPPEKITGYTRHGIESAMTHNGVGVKPSAILDAFKNPVKNITYDFARETFKYTGKGAVVVLNQAGKVVTTYAKSSLYWRIT